jgi:hypothetical protein
MINLDSYLNNLYDSMKGETPWFLFPANILQCLLTAAAFFCFIAVEAVEQASFTRLVFGAVRL